MENSDEDEGTSSMMGEALKILSEEGFKLPEDVVDTLTAFGRNSSQPRRKGSLRGHRMCEVQSNTRKTRNVREGGPRRSISRDRADEGCDVNQGRAEGDGNRENPNVDTSKQSQRYQETGPDDVFFTADDTDKNGTVPSTGSNGSITDRRGVLEREESSESNSTCSASTVREVKGDDSQVERGPYLRQDSGSSAGSSARSFNRKPTQIDDSHSSLESDTGYNTSIEKAIQVHEAQAENLKNINKHIENMSGKINGGLKRDLSRDSGFTEPGDTVSHIHNQNETVARRQDANSNSTTEFRDVTMSNSDFNERVISSDSGEAHVVTSTSSDLSAAEMSSRSDEITADGTAVSSAAKLSNQDSDLALSRTTVKRTAGEVSKEEDFESENRMTKSSRNDSISTSDSGVTTASSRHAASMDQDLCREKSKLSASTDGRTKASSISVDQQLARHQEVNNIEQSDDGSSKSESKLVSDKALMSKSLSEQQTKSHDGTTVGVIKATQELEASTKNLQNEESLVSADGTVAKRRLDSTSSLMSEKSTSEQNTVKQLPYGRAASTELMKKIDNSSVSKSSSSFNEVKETPTGRSETSKLEDSNIIASSFTGECESTEVINGVKLHRTASSENSSENKMKSSKSVSSYSTTGYDVSNDSVLNRRLSNVSNASTLSNMSALSRENINPPSYEETISNLSRQNSRPSALSRQDSGASSIASSASALHDRQRQKQKMMSDNRSDSVDSVTKLKEVVKSHYDPKEHAHLRQNSFSSESTISGGLRDDMHRNIEGRDYFVESPTSDRVITHPIRQVDRVQYTRALTDSVCDRPNRRATLHGDVIVTPKELYEAREDVRTSLRGKDDSYISRKTDDFRTQERSALRRVNGRKRGEDSFEKEVFRMVEKFFDDDDDDDDFGFGFRSKKNVEKTSHSTASRSHQNPYSTREDLSRLSTKGSVASRAASEYAASDSGLSCTARGRRLQTDSRYTGSEGVFKDTASDSGGYNRYGRNNIDSWDGNQFSPIDAHISDSLLASHSRNKNSNQYSNSASRYNAVSVGDTLQSEVKSINRDRNINTSIFGGNRRREYETMRSPITDDASFSDINDGSVYSGNYADSRCESDFDMSDAGSTCPSLRSLPPNVHRLRKEHALLDDFKSRSLPDISNSDGGGDNQYPGKKDAQWENRRQRIDKALSWIRDELGVLRSQDKVLMTQFQRCQDSIEQLKRQRPWYEVFSDDEEEEEEGERSEGVGRHWEDWEIDEFDRSCQSDRRDRQPGTRSSTNIDSGTRSSTNSKSGTIFTKEIQRVSLTTE